MPDLSLETQGFFPGRGRGWRAWEDEFLKTFSVELGLRICAEQLRRPPADVALRISWLGIQMPADKVSLASHGKSPAPKLTKKPQAVPHARAEAPEGWMTCGQVAELAGCKVGLVYSAIWKKKLDALQGDRGVWLVPEDAGREFAEARQAKTSKEAPERPAEAKESVPAVVLHKNTEDTPERHPEAQNGYVSKKPAETGLDLGSMSKLDILRAIASGKLEAASVG